MTFTGRFVALLALGMIPVVLLGGTIPRAFAVLGLWLLIVVLLGSLDLILAASPRNVVLERSLPARVRLGETVTSQLAITNTGTRGCRPWCGMPGSPRPVPATTAVWCRSSRGRGASCCSPSHRFDAASVAPAR